MSIGSGNNFPDIKVHGAHMGPIWGRQDPGGPHVGPMNFAIWVGAVRQWVITWNNVKSYVIIASLRDNKLIVGDLLDNIFRWY